MHPGVTNSLLAIEVVTSLLDDWITHRSRSDVTTSLASKELVTTGRTTVWVTRPLQLLGIMEAVAIPMKAMELAW